MLPLQPYEGGFHWAIHIITCYFGFLNPRFSDLRLLTSDLWLTHPSLGFAPKGNVWTVDVGLHYQAIAWREDENVVWFWIGTHEDYNNLMNRLG